MFLKKDKRPNGKTFLSIIRGYRDPITKKNKSEVVKKIGYMEDFLQDFPDPIEHFSKLAKDMTLAEAQEKELLKYTIDTNEFFDDSTKTYDDTKKIGHVILMYYYYLLNISNFLKNKQQSLKIDFNLDKILQMLVYLRILNPCSKLATTDIYTKYWQNHGITAHDTYRALDYFASFKDDLIRSLHEIIRIKRGRNLSNVYYDVTNYYFEIPNDDEIRCKGCSKENRSSPIIQMGLLMDANAIPITYKLFPGNTHDSTTLMPILSELKKDYNLKRVIVVADKGLNSNENIGYNLINKDGYIFSKSVRGASNELKKFVLAEDGYTSVGADYKFKSRIVTTQITVTNIHNKKVKVEVEQKQIAIYSEKYAKRARNERAKVLDKAAKLIQVNRTTPYASAYKYILKETVDPSTGEIIKAISANSIDTARIENEELYDGYYLIVTSELKMSDQDVINTYHGLWRIEESFKITKSELKTRPVYLQTKAHIEAHFLTCFLALTILRLMKLDLNNDNISIHKMISEIKNLNVVHLASNFYRVTYSSPIIRALARICKLDLSKKNLTLKEINNIFAQAKKAL